MLLDVTQNTDQDSNQVQARFENDSMDGGRFGRNSVGDLGTTPLLSTSANTNQNAPGAAGPSTTPHSQQQFTSWITKIFENVSFISNYMRQEETSKQV